MGTYAHILLAGSVVECGGDIMTELNLTPINDKPESEFLREVAEGLHPDFTLDVNGELMHIDEDLDYEQMKDGGIYE